MIGRLYQFPTPQNKKKHKKIVACPVFVCPCHLVKFIILSQLYFVLCTSYILKIVFIDIFSVTCLIDWKIFGTFQRNSLRSVAQNRKISQGMLQKNFKLANILWEIFAKLWHFARILLETLWVVLKLTSQKLEIQKHTIGEVQKLPTAQSLNSVSFSVKNVKSHWRWGWFWEVILRPTCFLINCGWWE